MRQNMMRVNKRDKRTVYVGWAVFAAFAVSLVAALLPKEQTESKPKPKPPEVLLWVVNNTTNKLVAVKPFKRNWR